MSSFQVCAFAKKQNERNRQTEIIYFLITKPSCRFRFRIGGKKLQKRTAIRFYKTIAVYFLLPARLRE